MLEDPLCPKCAFTPMLEFPVSLLESTSCHWMLSEMIEALVKLRKLLGMTSNEVLIRNKKCTWI